jgi:hypothetical protein
LALLIASGVSPLGAQELGRELLHDPTRPPQSLAVEGSTEALQAQASRERIQMLVIGESRKFAIIDGVMVTPGALLNQWRLVRIDTQGVVMQSASGAQKISIHPAVVKTVRPVRRSNSGPELIQNQPTRTRP